MSPFKEWLHQKKDASLSFLLHKALQHKLANYGRMLNLTIDSRQKSIRLELLLKGETEPIIILVHEYAITSDDQGTSLIIHRLSVSREWADTLAAQFLTGQKIPVPEKFQPFLKLLT
jgi:hypothetical protein